MNYRLLLLFVFSSLSLFTFSFSSMCFNSSNIGEIGTELPCENMLIVDRTMLLNAIEFNGGIDRYIEAHGLNFTFGDSAYNIFTGQVTNMASLFQSSNFNADIGYWDTRNVTNTERMFWEPPPLIAI